MYYFQCNCDNANKIHKISIDIKLDRIKSFSIDRNFHLYFIFPRLTCTKVISMPGLKVDLCVCCSLLIFCPVEVICKIILTSDFFYHY